MKLVLEVADNSYQTVLDFISLLPEKQCHVLQKETAQFNALETTNKKQFVKEYHQQVLLVNSKLRLALTIRNQSKLDESLTKHLKSRSTMNLGFDCLTTKWSVYTQFVEITVVKPTKEQNNLFELGGVFLKFKGLEQKGIVTTGIKIPIQENGSDIVVDSLNIALTRLSEKYEPWRKAHTGNVYDRVVYKEDDGKWYPLDVIRNSISAKKEEHSLVFKARQEVMKIIQEDMEKLQSCV
jgi:hypothetical protein